MYKKISLLFSLLLPIYLFSAQIVPYNPAKHKEAVTGIVFQDPHKLFADSGFLNKIGYSFAGFGLATGLAGRQISNAIGRKALYGIAAGWALVSGCFLLDNAFDFSKRKKNELENLLNDSKKTKRVLLNDKKQVAGFTGTFVGREQSIEALRKQCTDTGQAVTMTDQQFEQCFPGLKKTEQECKKILTIEWLAVDRACRSKGYGTLLINDRVAEAKKEGIPYADLNVANTNKGAKRLYEKLGFVPLNPQSIAFLLLGITQLRKSLEDQV